jgi:tetrahydromethanopterin S-methyltransferase subunit B
MADASGSKMTSHLDKDAPTPEAPEYAFDPTDPWTQTFQKGLARAGLQGKAVYEVGIGTGINAAFVLRSCKAAAFYGSDLDPRLVELAERNIHSLSPEHASLFQPVKGPVSLIDTDEAREKIAKTDVVIACIPQVGDPSDPRFKAFREEQSVPLGDGADEQSQDHIAHYYPWTMFDDYPFNAVGLGLNEALLRRLREHAPKAEVVMNFGCRVGIDTIFEMFRANGYEPEKLYSQIVLQDAGTDISFFVALEGALQGTGLEKEFVCKFFADRDGEQPLSALEAQSLIEKDPQVALYHEVSVVRGRPTAS